MPLHSYLMCFHSYSLSKHSYLFDFHSFHSNPLHVYSTIVDELYNNDEFCVSDIAAKNESDKSIGFFTEGARINSIFFEAIRDSDNELAGFAVSEFKETHDFSNKGTKEMTKTAMMDFVNSIRSIVVHKSIRENCESEDN